MYVLTFWLFQITKVSDIFTIYILEDSLLLHRDKTVLPLHNSVMWMLKSRVDSSGQIQVPDHQSGSSENRKTVFCPHMLHNKRTPLMSWSLPATCTWMPLGNAIVWRSLSPKCFLNHLEQRWAGFITEKMKHFHQPELSVCSLLQAADVKWCEILMIWTWLLLPWSELYSVETS